jgi:hypothetical protein
MDLGALSQPSQPKTMEKVVEVETAPTSPRRRTHTPPFGKTGSDGCDTAETRSSAVDLPVTTSKTEVVTPPEVVTPAQATPPTPPNWPAWGDQLLQLRAEHPDLIPAQLVNLLQAEHGITTDGRAVAQLLQEVEAQPGVAPLAAARRPAAIANQPNLWR